MKRKTMLWRLALMLMCLCLMGGKALAAEENAIIHGNADGEWVNRGVTYTTYPEVTAFTLDAQGGVLHVGDEVKFIVQVASDADIQNAYLNFGRSQDEDEYISLEYEKSTGFWTGSYTFQETDKSGTYYVTSCYVRDIYSFYTSYNSSSKRIMQRLLPGLVVFENKNAKENITNITLEEAGQELSPGDTLHLSFDLLPNMELSYMSATFYREGSGSNTWFEMEYSSWNEKNSLSYNAETGHVTGTYTLTDSMRDGKYRLSSIYVSFGQGQRVNWNKYEESYIFQLTGGIAVSQEKITISDITLQENGETLTDGETVHVTFRANSEDEITDAEVNLNLFNADRNSWDSGVYSNKYYSLPAEAEYDETADLWHAEYALQEEDVYGVYSVSVDVRTEDDSLSLDSDAMFLFAANAEERMNRLAPATELNWTKDGFIRFTLPEDHQGKVSIRIFEEGNRNWIRYITYNGFLGSEVWLKEKGEDTFLTSDATSGNYYFTVTVLGDGVTYYDSVTAKSDLYTYKEPSKQLGVATKLEWIDVEGSETKQARFTMPKDKTNLGGYQYEWYFAETGEETPIRCGNYGTRWFYEDPERTYGYATLWDSVIQEFGDGFYFYRVRTLSSNIIQCRNGEWSDLSEGYAVGGVSNTVLDRLSTVPVNADAEEIREQVQAIDTEELKTAMLANDSVQDALRRLEAAADAKTEVVVTEDAPKFPGEITTLGAGLNGTQGDVTLIVDKPAVMDALPAAYDNTLAVRFSMSLENVADPDDLSVPVLIDMPIPETINPDFLIVLHYHLSDGTPEVISPTVYRAGSRWYAQFALTSFSDFILTQPRDGDQELTVLILPESTKVIEAGALKGTGANVIIVPAGCQRIESEAFAGCPSLIEVQIPGGQIESIAEDAFKGSTAYIVSEDEAVRAFADKAGIAILPESAL